MLRHFHLHLRLFNNLQHMLVGGIPTRLKNMKVSWDDEIPNIWENKIHVPNHQPVCVMVGTWLKGVMGIR